MTRGERVAVRYIASAWAVLVGLFGAGIAMFGNGPAPAWAHLTMFGGTLVIAALVFAAFWWVGK